MLPIVPLSKKNLASRLSNHTLQPTPLRARGHLPTPVSLKTKSGGMPAGFPSKSTAKRLDVHAGNWSGDWSSQALTITILYVLDQERY